MSEVQWVFIVGCPRSGTTWMLDIFKHYDHAIINAESAILEILREPWWRTHDAPIYKRGRPVKEAEKKGFRANAEDLAEKLLIRNQPEWYEKWRGIFLSYFGDRTAFILNYSKLFPKRTIWSGQRSRLIPFWDFYELVAAAEEADLGSRDERAAFITQRMIERFINKHGKSHHLAFVEKTPSHLFHTDFLLDHFPQARVIEMVRDCRDVCVSMDFYKQWMPQNREFQVWQWNEYVKKGLELRATERYKDRIYKARFEDLKADTHQQLTQVFDFLELPTENNTVEEIITATQIKKMKRARPGQHYRKGVVGDWKEHLDSQDLELIKNIAGESFAAAGYRW